MRGSARRGRCSRLALRGHTRLRRREHRPQAPDSLRARPRVPSRQPGHRPGGRLPPPRQLLPVLRRPARPIRGRGEGHAHRGKPALATPAIWRRELPLLALCPHLGIGPHGGASGRNSMSRCGSGTAGPRGSGSRLRAMFTEESERRYWRYVWDSSPEIENWDAQWSYVLLAREGLAATPNRESDLQYRLGGDATNALEDPFGIAARPLEGASFPSSTPMQSSETPSPTPRPPSSFAAQSLQRRPHSAGAPGPRRCGPVVAPSTSSPRRFDLGSGTGTGRRRGNRPPSPKVSLPGPRGRHAPSTP